MLQGLRTIVYPAPDLERAKIWFSATLGVKPYFDQPFYVGFNIGGYELGLDPDVALAELLKGGAPAHAAVRDVGEGIRLAAVREPGGAILGVIENPHF